MKVDWLFAGILFAAAVPAATQPLPLTIGGDSSVRVEWGRVIATAGDDWINDLVPLRNGNLLGVGFLNRSDGSPNSDWLAVSVELQSGGTIASQRRYGDQGGSDAFWSAVESADGRRVFAGFTTRVGPGGINAYVLVSRADGTIVKENGLGYAGYDRFTDLAPAGDGFVFVGHSQLTDQGALRRTYIVKTDPNGLPVWERIYGGPETWSALYIEPAGDGGFVIAGGTDGGGDSDIFVQRVDADGRELWRKRVGTPDWDEINHGLVVRPDGRIVVVGYTHSRGSEVNDVVAATLSAEGEVERLERFGGSGDDRAILAKADSAGMIWIVGQTASAGAGGSDLLLTSLDANGAFTGTAVTLGGAADDNGTAVLPLGTDAVVVAGYSRNLGIGAQDAFIARLSRPASARANPAFRRTVVTPAR
jgi:hypothetical protein